MDLKREERGNRWRQREGAQEKGKRGGLEEDTQRQGEREKKTQPGSVDKATAEKTCPLCFHLSLCNLLTSQTESRSKSSDSQSTQT